MVLARGGSAPTGCSSRTTATMAFGAGVLTGFAAVGGGPIAVSGLGPYRVCGIGPGL